MSIETSFAGTLVIIFAMGMVTLVARWGGVFIMSFVPISERVQRFITAMSGSVLVALLAPLAVEGDNGARMALLSTAVVMFVVKKPLPAIAAGIIAAAAVRAI
ncbi:AzlD domain-containing protein [Vibrio sp. STUT-A11]|uniref:AzlD domain-containing protein n=1 Tax=unclassified Vibrio TaxID=2614977 RepID=UPI002231307A|nr:AzlD domain-containing protein [Vibrio sp. STUT-A11]BDR16227.1 branched-chain amino acid transporter [Vibrio sp. STUT-A11]